MSNEAVSTQLDDATMASEPTASQNGRAQAQATSDPTEVANLVLWHISAVNDRQGELTAATKALTDLVKQLLRAYGEHTQIIRRQEGRLRDLASKISQKG